VGDLPFPRDACVPPRLEFKQSSLCPGRPRCLSSGSWYWNFNRLLSHHATVPPHLSVGSKVPRYSPRLSEAVLSHGRRSEASLGAPSAMLLSPSTFRREVRRCFSHFVAVALFRVWTMEPHRRTTLRSAGPCSTVLSSPQIRRCQKSYFSTSGKVTFLAIDDACIRTCKSVRMYTYMCLCRCAHSPYSLWMYRGAVSQQARSSLFSVVSTYSAPMRGAFHPAALCSSTFSTKPAIPIILHISCVTKELFHA
jgi:hypothetical protein